MEQRRGESYYQWRRRVIAAYTRKIGGLLPAAITKSKVQVQRIAARVQEFQTLKRELRDQARQREEARLAALAQRELEADLEVGLTDQEIAVLLGLEPEAPEWAIEELADGRVIWAQPAFALAKAVYEQISRGLRPGTQYKCYLRTISGRDYRDGDVQRDWIRGRYRGDNIGQHWRPFALARGEFPRGRQLTAGRLEALAAKLRVEHTRGYIIGWLVALVPQGEPGRRWLGMREGEANCVAVAIKRAIEQSKKGRPLKTMEEAVLEGFTKRVARDGALEEDLLWLCRQLKKRIELRDLEGALLWGPEAKGKPMYQSRGTIILTRTNGHAYHTESDKALPPVTSLRVYLDGTTMYRGVAEALRADTLTRQEEKVLAEFASQSQGWATDETLHDLCDRLGRRIELRTAEGHLLWAPQREMVYPSLIARGIETAAGAIGEKIDGETLLERERRQLRATALLIQREGLVRAFQVGSEIVDAETGVLYRPLSTDIALCAEEASCPGEGPDYNIKADGKPLELLCLGGAQAVAFRRWREDQGLDSLPKVKVVRDAWRAANFEAVPWAAAEEMPEGATCVDMRAAYLGCDKRPEMAQGAAHDWAKRFGFPKGGTQRRALVSTLEEVERLAGCVRFTKLVLNTNCPEPIRAQMAAHLELHGPWLTIPMAIYLRDAGLLRDYAVEQVVYSVGRVDGLTFPSRDQAVRFVGSCKYSGRKQCFWTRDEAEAVYYAGKYGAFHEPIDGLYRVNYDTQGERQDHSYVRAYVLAYMFIGMADAMQRLPEGAVLACKVDSLTLAPGHSLPEAHSADTPKERVPYGAFRAAAVPKPVTTLARELRDTFESAEALPTTRLAEDPLYLYPLSFLDGQGGTGKTHRALRAFPGRRVVVLGKDNEHCRDLADPEKNPQRYPCFTYHEYFHLGAGKPSEWDPVVMGRKRPDVVVWDEIGCVPPCFLQLTLDWLARVHAVAVLCGDPLGQLQAFGAPYSGNEIAATLRANGAYIEVMETDWRAKDCPELQALKRRCWRQDESEQVAALRSLPAVTEEELLAAWTPEDLVVVLTNQQGERLAKRLEERRAAKYPEALVRYRFRPTAERRKRLYQKKGGQLKKVLSPAGTMVDAIVGLRVVAPADAQPGLDWIADNWSTLHSLQGKTLKTGRLFIVEEGFGADWCRNAAYTAISRVTRISQLVRVTAARAPAIPPSPTNSPPSTYSLDDLF